ncbi:hypothetical protein Celaphus_00011029 [Cervus elaphus hippelaphus]|uniref:Uncharacterized protein n=1 Tax=Cervus elaphus hippelaphus TaxID=46360 RepID=A0A212CRR4_CEREH|nr:hypothetical protein Celaphus_00011029 [Cervus elaphus hippelaphus]
MEKALSARLWCPPAATSTVSSPRHQQDPRSGRPSFLLGVLQLTQDLSTLPPSAKEVIKIVEHHSDSDHTLTSPGKEGSGPPGPWRVGGGSAQSLPGEG